MINAIVAIGQTDWEGQFVSGLTHPMTGIQVQRRCVDAVDALAVSKVLSCDIVIISDHTMRVDRDFVSEIRNQNIRLIALTNNANYFEDFGVSETVALDPTNPLASISVLSALARVNKAELEPEVVPTGEMVFVGGFGGGVGKTRLALELAYQFAKQNNRALLIDGDTYGPALLQYFGLAPNVKGLLEICREIERKNNGDKIENLASTNLMSNLDLLVGINKPSRWIDLRTSVVTQLWQLCLAQYSLVVVDGGPILEHEPLAAIETGLPKRNLVALSALAASRKVLLICPAQPLAVTKLIKGLAENSALFLNKDVSIAVLGGKDKKQAKDALVAIATHTNYDNLIVVERNEELIEKATSQSSFIGAIAAKSSLANNFVEISKEIFLPTNRLATDGRLNRMFSRRHVLSEAS